MGKTDDELALSLLETDIAAGLGAIIEQLQRIAVAPVDVGRYRLQRELWAMEIDQARMHGKRQEALIVLAAVDR